MEKEMEMNVVAPTAPTRDDDKNIAFVFAHWQKTMQHPHAKLDEVRKKCIRTAINWGYSPAHLCQAIDGCSRTPHNVGVNDKGERYDGLHLILRNGDQIDRFVRNSHSPPRVLNGADRRLQANVDALKQWASQKLNTEENTDANT